MQTQEKIRQIITEEVMSFLGEQQFRTLSELLQMIDIPDFKNFIKNIGYDINNVDELTKGIVYWGKGHGIDFTQYNLRDLRKIAEYMQALVFA